MTSVDARSHGSLVPPTPPPGGDEETFVFPASFAQRRMWILELLEPGSSAYHVPLALRLRGAFDVAALERAVEALIARHESLRTTFDEEDGELVQVVHSPYRARIPVVTLEHIPIDDREREATRLVQQESQAPFDLRRGPLVRVSVLRLAAEEHVLLVTLHHIITDGWSKGIFFRELSALYAGMRNNQPVTLSELPVQYGDYAVWQQQQLRGEELERLVAYWRSVLPTPLPRLELPTDSVRPIDTSGPGAIVSLQLSEQLTARIRDTARAARATPFMALTGAYAALLQRYSGDELIVIGTPVAGRTQREMEGLIGLFVNTLAVPIDLSGRPSYRSLLGRVRDAALGAFAHEALPFEKLVEVLQPERQMGRHPVFQVDFALQNAPSETVSLEGLEVSSFGSAPRRAKFDLSLTAAERDGRLRLMCEYRTDLFEAATAHRFLAQLELLLDRATAAPDAPLATIALLTEAEHARIVGEWSGTPAARPEATVHDLVIYQCAATPSFVAAEYGADVLTYRDLDLRSRQLAMYLGHHGVTSGTRVGVFLEPSLEFAVALLGTLRAGGVCVPLDRGYPAERLAYMLADAGIDTVLTASALAAELPAQVPQIVRLDADWPMVAAGPQRPLPTVEPADAAYVLYTSGSTGQPRGIVLSHRGLVNHHLGVCELYGLTDRDRTLQFCSVSFDVCIEEIYPTWIAGGTVVFKPRQLLGVGADFAEWIATCRITVLNLPTGYWHEWVSALSQAHATVPSCVRLVLIGGDRANATLLARWRQVAGPRTRLMNAYGPAEATITATVYELPGTPTPDETRREIPIGRPLSNVRVYVLDESGKSAPAGIPGEICIGGVGVGIGYLGRAELTAERFLSDPFDPTGTGRMYRTGDRARYRNDGTLEFLGRTDFQVKIRGYRIEPAEVEAILAQHPAVESAAVVPFDSAAGGKRLAAYVVPQGKLPPAPEALRRWARERLPEYMVPSAVTLLDALPLTSNGKVDRRALPAPDPVSMEGTTYALPRTTLQWQLVQIWERLLGIEPIGIHDDFFDRGGHSLLAARMLFEVERATGLRVPLTTLFDCATIEHLAKELQQVAQMGAGARAELIVVQQGSPGKVPIAFVHGDWSGGGLYCRNLAVALGPDQPFYALPPHLPDDPGAPRTIEDMARAHVTVLRTRQPHGPYRLGGYCNGGFIALEMARLLRVEGEQVDQLFVVDAWALNARFRPLARFFRFIHTLAPNDHSREEIARLRARTLSRLRPLYQRWRRFNFYPLRERLAFAAGWLSRRGRRLLVRAARAVGFRAIQLPPAPERTLPVAEEADATLRYYSRAVNRFVPRWYDGPVHLICSTQTWLRWPDRTLGWELVTPRLTVHQVHCANHNEIVTVHLPGILAQWLTRPTEPPAA
jgi:amino acid adenylation domain-containing protein